MEPSLLAFSLHGFADKTVHHVIIGKRGITFPKKHCIIIKVSVSDRIDVIIILGSLRPPIAYIGFEIIPEVVLVEQDWEPFISNHEATFTVFKAKV